MSPHTTAVGRPLVAVDLRFLVPTGRKSFEKHIEGSVFLRANETVAGGLPRATPMWGAARKKPPFGIHSRPGRSCSGLVKDVRGRATAETHLRPTAIV